MQRRSKILAASGLALAVLAVMSWIGVRKRMLDGALDARIRPAHAALRSLDPFALARIDLVTSLGSAGVPSHPSPPGAAAGQASAGHLALLTPLGAPAWLAGAPALLEGARYGLLGVSAAERPSDAEPTASALSVAAVLLGRFDPAALEAQLRKSLGNGLEASERGAERRLSFETVDVESCARTEWALAVSPERAVIRSRGPVEPVLAALTTAAGESPATGGIWPWDAPSPLLALELRPGALAAALEHPLARGLGAALAPARSASLRIGRPGLLGSLDVTVELTAAGAAEAESWVRRWKALQREIEGSPGAPVLRAWHGALEIEREAPGVRARGTRPAEALEQLASLARESLRLAASAPPAPPAPAGATSAVEPWPTPFAESLSAAGLPRYGDPRSLDDPVDQIRGPFGITLERVTRSGPGAPLELELSARAARIPNLVEPERVAKIYVNRVLDREGNDLRLLERCGPRRPEIGAPLRTELLGDRIAGRLRVRLREDVQLDEVARIEGRVLFALPSRVQRAVQRAPRDGAELRAGDFALQLSGVTERAFVYDVPHASAPGPGPHLLAIRGRNAEHQPLRAQSAWDWTDPYTGGRIGARHYATPLSSVEAIFEIESQGTSYPFALSSGRPGTDGAALHVESSLHVPYAPEQYRRDHADSSGAEWEFERQPVAAAVAGPFRVGLMALSRVPEPGADADAAGPPALAPTVTVLAPPVPNLTYDATALELRLGERDAPRARWRTLIQPRYRFGRDHLRAELELKRQPDLPLGSVHSLVGELRLRIPREVDTLAFDRVEPGASVRDGDFQMTLVALGRDRLSFQMRGPLGQLFSARAFAQSGEELSCRPLELSPDAERQRTVEFEVHGRPARIEIQRVRDFAEWRYPLQLELTRPAAPDAPAP